MSKYEGTVKFSRDDMNEYRGIFLQAFERATETQLNNDTKAEALHLARLYAGDQKLAENSPLTAMFTFFLLGIGEGMKLADAIDHAAK